jgi:tetratricopeptide (TPR) repeat protein
MLFSVLNRILDRPLLHFILITAVGLLVYSNTFEVPFHYDDNLFIVRPPLIKDFSYFTDSEKVDGLFLIEDVLRYFKTRKVGFLSFWASYKLGGMDVGGYHAANLLIHIINSVLVYLIVTLIFKTPLLSGSRISENSRRIALFSGLLFVAHPMQTEAVTYILQRLVLLAAMFYLLSTTSYIGARLSEGKPSKYGLYALALVSAVLAMKTKENAFTLPLAVVLCEFIFFRGSIRKRAVLLVPFLLTMLIIPIAYIGLNVEGGIGAAIDSASRLGEKISKYEYLCTQFRVVTSYIRLLLIPVGQNLVHDPAFYQSFFELPVFLSFLFLMSVLGLGVNLFYRSRITDNSARLVAFGIFWFFLALSVESSVLPRGEMMVEYRVYLPSAGAVLALGTGAFLFMGRLKEKAMRKVVVSFLIVLLLVFSTATYARNTVWKSDIDIWEDVVKKSPENNRAHYNLGNAYRNVGLVDKAVEQYEAASNLGFDFPMVYCDLGNDYASKGLFNEAIEYYKIALRLNPDLAEAHNNLGYMYHYKGLNEKAIAHFLTAVSHKPEDADVHFNLGLVYFEKGLIEEARREFDTALLINPDYHDAKQYISWINKMQSQ